MRLVNGILFKANRALKVIVSYTSRSCIIVFYSYAHIISSTRHALTTPLIFHADRHRRLRELLLRLGLAVRLVLLADSLAAGIL